MRWKDARLKPDFVIIGAQKAGSGALMAYLRRHPHLYLPQTETRYFRDPWFTFQDSTVLDEAVQTTERGVSRRGIKSVALLASAEAPERIMRTLGPVRLVAVLREPVERAISAYHFYMSWGWLPIAPAEDGLRRLLDGTYAADYPRSGEVLQYGLYSQHIERFLCLFPRKNLHLLLTDDLHADFASAAAKVLDFVGVDPNRQPASKPSRANVGVYSEARIRFRQRRVRYRMRRFHGYPGTYVDEPSGVWAWIADRSIVGIDRMLLAHIYGNTRPNISPTVRGELAEFYTSDLQRLPALLRRDLSRWEQASGMPSEGS